VPGTINSKTNTEVKIVRKWDGYRPNIRYILLKYESWLLSEEYKRRKIGSKLNAYKRSQYSCSMNVANIYWIENLLKEKPLADLRKFVCYWILSRYLINVRRLTPEQSYSIMMDWLQRCNRLKRLSPSLDEFKRRVKRDIKEAIKSGKLPIGKQSLKDCNLV
jgi:hypothetical protein